MPKIDTQIIHLNMPLNLLNEIEEYQLKKGITTRTSTILELIRHGLKAK